MHPLLTRNRLGLYLLAWVPLTATSAYVLATRGTLGWLPATVLAVAVFLFYAFLCLSAWYPCRATPLGRVSFLRLLLTHLSAAVLISFVWTQAGAALAYAILSPEKFEAIRTQFRPQLNSIFTIGVLLYLLSVAFHYVLIAMEDSRHAEAQAVEARVLARDAELKALKAQVNPHFLFNSLNSISALTSIDPARARDMCVLLGDFLRLTLGLGEKTSVRFSEELDLLQKYMAIEKVRFGTRLTMLEEIQEESKPCLLPPLLLQPLVENAVKHGIASLPEGGQVRVAAQRQNGRLAILVENSWDPDSPPRRSGGRGLKNVQLRLEARYGKDASLHINNEGDLFQVSLSLPAETEEQP
ncbi:MAG: sensor histidine kinase [Acidobacteria bacterium]|nr:MAG: sensor histidine kinase [Acidobacteriota bacterium]